MSTLVLPIPRRPAHPTGVWGWLTTVDHKRIGILYGVTAFILFLSGGVEAMVRVWRVSSWSAALKRS